MSKRQLASGKAEATEDGFEYIEEDEADEVSSYTETPIDDSVADGTESIIDVTLRPKTKSCSDVSVESVQKLCSTGWDSERFKLHISIIVLSFRKIFELINKVKTKPQIVQLQKLQETCIGFYNQVCFTQTLASLTPTTTHFYEKHALESLPCMDRVLKDTEHCLIGLKDELHHFLRHNENPTAAVALSARLISQEMADLSLAEKFTSISVQPARNRYDWLAYRDHLQVQRDKFDDFRMVFEYLVGGHQLSQLMISRVSSASYAYPKLRNELYRLKDTLSGLLQSITMLEAASTTAVVSVISSVRPDVETLRQALAQYLSNTDLDWLQCGTDTELCFAEFRTLDVQSFTGAQRALDDWRIEITDEAKLQQVRLEYSKSWLTDVGLMNEEAMNKLLSNIDYNMDILTELKRILKA